MGSVSYLIPAQEATVYLPTRIHPEIEQYAQKRFKRVLQPSKDGLSADECIAQADGIGKSSPFLNNL